MATSNVVGIDLKGKTVLVRKSWFAPEYREGDRRFVCSGGFGCNPDAMGTKIFGDFVDDGSHACITRGDIEKVLD